MALRNNPYLPLYVQDFMTDEKLMECSAEATGIYIRLMCLMHKSEEYGKILLKQKYKQTDKQILNFATQLAKFFPYDFASIERGLTDLIDENVIEISGDYLLQKRMIKDNEVSEKRASAGRNGGNSTQLKISKKIKKKDGDFAKAKSEANTDIEIENENDIENDIKDENNLEKNVEKKFFDQFNSKCTGLSKVQILNQPRKTKIAARIRDVGIEKAFGIIETVAKSNFLNGENDRNWKATFDWILEPKNFTKILEGNYNNKPNAKPTNQNNGFNSHSAGAKIPGKVSATTAIARHLTELASGNRESGNFATDAEIV